MDFWYLNLDLEICKRAARRAHKAEIGFVRPAHIIIAVIRIGVYAIAYFLPR